MAGKKNSKVEAQATTDETKNLGDVAYRAVRELIVAGRFRPGERVREAKLADMIGISRTPIRSAISRLVTEGLLSASPTQGVIITKLDEDYVLELYAALEALESTAAALAATLATDAERERLIEIYDLEAAAGLNVAKRMQLNDAFHQAICSAARNRFLTPTIARVYDSLHLLKGSIFDDPQRPPLSHEEHGQMLNAIRQRDPELASEAARNHVREARRFRMKMLFRRD